MANLFNYFGTLFSTKPNVAEPIVHKTNTDSKKERTDNPEKQQRETALGYSNMAWLYGGLNQMENPEKLIRLKGANVWHKMLNDDQVNAAFNLKINLIISRGFRFVTTGENQEQIVDFFKRNIQDLISGTWLDALRGVLMGKAYGFSVSEKVYESMVVDGKLRWVLKKLSVKPYDSIKFSSDKYGNLTGLSQTNDQLGATDTKLDMDKFVIYINKPEIDSIWGASDLKPAYRPYFYKDLTEKYWNVYIERLAGGFPVITPNDRAGNLSPDERTAMEQVVRNTTGISGVILPQGYDMNVVQAEDTEAFQKKSAHHDKQITRSIIIPNLLGFSEQGSVGSYSQSQTQFNVFMMLIKEDGDRLAECLNEQFFSQSAFWNFGVTDYPRFTFDEFTEEQKREIAKVWIEALKGNAVSNMIDDELRTRELLLYPTPEKEELEEHKEKNKPPVVPPVVPDAEGDDEDTNVNVKTNDKTKSKTKAKTKDDSTEDSTTAQPPKTTKQSDSGGVHINIQAERSPHIHTERDQASVSHADSEIQITFADRVDFKLAEEQLDDVEESFYDGMADNVDAIQDELIAAITKLNRTRPKDKNDVDFKQIQIELNKAVSPKVKKRLKRAVTNNLRATYNLGWNIGHKATLKAARQAKAPEKFINRINSVVLMSERNMCVEETWSVVHFVEGLSLEAADAWFASRSFKITGDLTDTMVTNAVNIMTNGITNDWSTRQMVDEMLAANLNITGGTLKQERARLNTIVRTNMSTIFTQAQLAFYNDPDLRGFVEAMEYSAIIDRRTTPGCARLDQSVYPMNDAIWRFITPPNHHQCRSVLVPVTILDKWQKDRAGFTAKQLPGVGFGKTGLAKMFDIKL